MKKLPGRGLLAAALLTMGAAPAFAGFQWLPAPRPAPAAPASSSVAESLPQAPAVPPVGVDVTPLPGAPVDAAPARPMPSVDAAATAPAPALAAPMMPAAASGGDAGLLVAGFGRDMPLALALRQIVPPSYAYAFDEGVNPGTKISWDGGRPWQQVLNDSLASAGMKSWIDGGVVRIGSASAAPLPAAVPPVAAVSPPPPSASSPPAMLWTGSQGGMNDAVPVSAPPVPAEPSYPRHVPMASPPAASASMPVPPVSGIQPPGAQALAATETAAGSPLAPAAPPVPVISRADAQDMPPADAAPASIVPAISAAQPDAGYPAPAPGFSDLTTSRHWSAQQGQSLKLVLEQWCQQAGVDLYWTGIADYTLPRAIETTGTFPDAAREALSAFNADAQRPVGKLHASPGQGTAILVVDSYLRPALASN